MRLLCAAQLSAHNFFFMPMRRFVRYYVSLPQFVVVLFSRSLAHSLVVLFGSVFQLFVVVDVSVYVRTPLVPMRSEWSARPNWKYIDHTHTAHTYEVNRAGAFTHRHQLNWKLSGVVSLPLFHPIHNEMIWPSLSVSLALSYLRWNNNNNNNSNNEWANVYSTQIHGSIVCLRETVKIRALVCVFDTYVERLIIIIVITNRPDRAALIAFANAGTRILFLFLSSAGFARDKSRTQIGCVCNNYYHVVIDFDLCL